MQTEAAVLWARGEPWSVEPIELDDPRPGEVLVRIEASGLCHSDGHLRTGDLPSALPIIGGHEGAGVVEQVGEGVTSVAPGDHVVFGFIPACGRCPACSTGHQNQCDVGAVMGSGLQITDQTARHHARGQDLALMCLLGTFARHTVVNEAQCVRIERDTPFEVACLAGCAVITGYGSTIYAGEVQPGDDVTVIGVGGVGVNAVQAARIAGARRIFAVDPVPHKRDLARTYGATHTAESIDAAYQLIKSETGGRMSKRVIVTMDVARADLLHPILRLTAKLGRVVLVSLATAGPQPVTINLFDLTMREKQLVGSLSGSANPHHDIPKLLDLYRAGLLDLDSQISRTYPLEKINEGYADMACGTNLRGVLVMHFVSYFDDFKTVALTRDDDGILTVRFHSRGGPMTWTAVAHREAPKLFAAIADDPDNKAVILTGTGERFIDTPTGYGDVYRSGKVKPSDWERGIWEANRTLHTLLDIRVPVIAAINGPVTGHAEIPLLSDIVVCSDDTYFQDAAHVPNNLIPGDGVHVVWPALLGPNRARYFLLTAEKIPASEARTLGIVAEVLPREQVLPRAYELARTLLETDPLVLRYTRHLLLRPMRRAMADELNVGLGLEAYASVSRFPAFDEEK